MPVVSVQMTPWFQGFFGLISKIINPIFIFIGAFAFAVFKFLKKVYNTPSRPYVTGESVGKEYDNWQQEGILEYYWGEHIHLGFYGDEDLKKGYVKKNFIQAKYDLIEEMLKFGNVTDPQKVLDVGCGIGGTSRYIANKFPKSQVLGVTIANRQVERAKQLAKDRGVMNADFQVQDAMKMNFPENSFDLVWACESGEHMPDKKKYIENMVRVLKPGGRLVMCTWCQRHSTPQNPFSEKEKVDLQYLYDEWGHPYFISIEDYAQILKDTKVVDNVRTDNWAKWTISSWWHSIWVGVFDPLPVFTKPKVWYKITRDIYCLTRFHNAYASGLMNFGVFTCTKKLYPNIDVSKEEANKQQPVSQ